MEGDAFDSLAFLADAFQNGASMHYDPEGILEITLYAVWDEAPAIQKYDRTINTRTVEDATDEELGEIIEKIVLDGEDSDHIVISYDREDSYGGKDDGIKEDPPDITGDMIGHDEYTALYDKDEAQGSEDIVELKDVADAVRRVREICDELSRDDDDGRRDSGSCEIIIYAKDEAGNVTEDSVMLWVISDTSNETDDSEWTLTKDGYTRFINEDAYNTHDAADYSLDNYRDYGGLNPYSLWYVDDDYSEFIKTSFKKLSEFEEGEGAAGGLTNSSIWTFTSDEKEDVRQSFTALNGTAVESYIKSFYGNHSTNRERQ